MMNLNPKPSIISHPREYLPEFEQVIRQKSQNFVGRDFAFTAISDFLQRYNRGYFSIVGAPGSGKSAILAKLVTDNPDVIYYNAQIEGKHLAAEFLASICTQLINQYSLNYTFLPDDATEGSWFLSLLLQKISDQLQPNQKLIIAIDALDAVERNSQLPGSNIFYLLRYLPEKIYFIITRRPFLREKSGLLIETPSQTLNLSDLRKKNSQDLYRYIQYYLTLNSVQIQRSGETEQSLKSWLSHDNIGKEELSDRAKSLSTERDRLTIESENNFMYLSQILSAITEGFYPEPWQRYQLPPGLEIYYQQHWQKMTAGSLSDIALKVLRVLTSVKHAEGISSLAISQAVNEDEYEVEEVLENWFEFLQQKRIGNQIYYSFYHSSFGNWLALNKTL